VEGIDDDDDLLLRVYLGSGRLMRRKATLEENMVVAVLDFTSCFEERVLIL
jgi:hypothetical protein